MGIYLPNLEMPRDKAVAVVIHPDGTAYTAEMFAGVCTEYLADCTAVPVPPHGRLIDADELRQSIKESIDECHKWADEMREAENDEMVIRAEQSLGTFVECGLRVKNAPTIIAAEPPKEET